MESLQRKARGASDDRGGRGGKASSRESQAQNARRQWRSAARVTPLAQKRTQRGAAADANARVAALHRVVDDTRSRARPRGGAPVR